MEEGKDVNIDVSSRGNERRGEMGHVCVFFFFFFSSFLLFTLCVLRLKASGPFWRASGARYMFGLLFVKREQVLVR